MKRIVILTTGFVLTVVVAALLWPAPPAQAQAGRTRPHRSGTAVRAAKPMQTLAESGCKPLVALVHGVLPTSKPLADTDTWGGPIFATLAGEFLGMNAVMSGNDGEEAWYEEGNVGVGKGGAYKICTDYPTCANTFTLDVPFAVFHGTADALMTYSAYNVTIVNGTGKFAGASGNVTLQGPATAWLDEASPFGASGRWNGAISGQLCGVK